MSLSKKIKTANSGRSFQYAWTVNYGMVERSGKALCCLCYESVVCRTSSVKRHFETNHKNVVYMCNEDQKEILAIHVNHYEIQSNEITALMKANNNLTAAGFEISLSIAKHRKPLSDGDYIKEVMVSCSNSLFEDFPNKDEIIQRIKDMPCSRNTVKDRVKQLQEDVHDQLQYYLQATLMYSVGLLMEGRTDGSQSRLAIIVRFSALDEMHEELIQLATLPDSTTCNAICNVLIKVLYENNIPLSKVVSVTTDGTPGMVGLVSLFETEVGHSVIQFNCLLHQKVLFFENIEKKFVDVVKVVTKVVNLIIAHAPNNSHFKFLLQEVFSQSTGVIIYNNVTWWNRGMVLNRFVECLDEIRLFLMNLGEIYSELNNLRWLSSLMFFVNFTEHLNELNKTLQIHGMTVDICFEKIQIFEKKLAIFKKDVLTMELKYFPCLKKYFNSGPHIDSFEDKNALCSEFVDIIVSTSQLFESKLLKFRQFENILTFIRNPLKANFSELDLSAFEWLDIKNFEMELVEFQGSSLCKEKFSDLNNILCKLESVDYNERDQICFSVENEILKVWNSLPTRFSSLKKIATALLTMFGSTYMCDQLFSVMNNLHCNTLNNEMTAACVALMMTKYKPRVLKLVAEQQEHKSH